MYLPEDMHRYLAREAEARGISMAEVAREAISQYRASREEARAPHVAALIGVLGDDVVDPGMSMAVDEVFSEYFGPDGDWEQENGLADGTR